MNIKPFIDSLAINCTTETLRAYRQDLERFQAFLQERGLRVNQVKPITITEFINYLSEHKGRTVGGQLQPATVARHLAVLSSYYQFLNANSDETIQNPAAKVRRPKVQNALPRAVEEDVLSTLINGITDPRDKAIILLFLYSGLRLSELRQLNTNTISVRRRTLPNGSVEDIGVGEVIGKGRKRRCFLVGLKAVQAVAEYIALRPPLNDEPALFLSSRRGRLSSRALQQIVDKWCRRLGLDHVHVHQLRHSFATRNVNAGMSSVVLKELMGHSSLTTTQRYFRVKPERLSREYFSVMEFVKSTALS